MSRPIDADLLGLTDMEIIMCDGDYKEALKMLIDKIEHAPTIKPEPRWIPCSERLPEERDAGILKKLGTNKLSDYVLMTVDVRGTQMTDVGCTHDGVWQWKHKYAFPDWTVIAWMPLPEPYTERREE